MKHIKAATSQLCPMPCGCAPTWWCETFEEPVYDFVVTLFPQLAKES